MSPLLPDGPIDSLGVRQAILATPEAVAAAARDDIELPPFAGTHGMVLVASGADALVAQAAQALVAPWSPVPVFVHTGHGLPDFVSDEWRCVFVSTAPTREADSAACWVRRAATSTAQLTSTATSTNARRLTALSGSEMTHVWYGGVKKKFSSSDEPIADTSAGPLPPIRATTMTSRRNASISVARARLARAGMSTTESSGSPSAVSQ